MGREMGGRVKREGTYAYLRLIHVDVWQKPTPYCKAIILQLKINLKNLRESSLKKKKKKRVLLPGELAVGRNRVSIHVSILST